MKKKIFIAYGIATVLMCLLGLYIAVCFRLDTDGARADAGYRTVEQYEIQWVEDTTLPCGGMDVIQFPCDEDAVRGGSLCFHAVHQSVEVYVGDELVYRIRPSENNRFGMTPGNNWVSVPLYERDKDKMIRISLIPAYGSSVHAVSEIYLGNKWNIFVHVLKNNAVICALSVVAVLVGICFVAWTWYNRKNVKVNKSLFALGIFSIWIGIWKLTDSEAVGLFIHHSVFLSYFTLIALLMVYVPFIMFLRVLFTKNHERLWNVLMVANLVLIAATVFMQLAGIRDFRQNLVFNHLLMACLILAVFICIAKELRQNGWNKKTKLAVIGISSCLVGLVGDMLMFYLFKGLAVSGIGMICFLGYVIVLGIINVQESKQLMAAGVQAERYQNIAYHDQLTGLYSRAAYTEYINSEKFRKEDCMVVMCDLNNLKTCNDVYGHEAGDRYINRSTEIICNTFGKLGRCFRMGGDEFCILMNKVSLEDCERAMGDLREQENKHNAGCPDEFPIHIACGYAGYDISCDYDISDTFRRADKQMYKNKVQSKIESKSSEGIR